VDASALRYSQRRNAGDFSNVDRFDFTPTTLRDLISTRYFTVPRYQRSYAWTSDEVDDFWTDMIAAISEGGDYFLGNIVLTSDGGNQTFSIIDGQQRIATTTLLSAAMRDIYQQESESDIASVIQLESVYATDTSTFEKVPRIRLNEVDNPFYSDLIITSSNPAPTRESHTLIQEAYRFFRQKLMDLKSSNPGTWKNEFGKISNFLKSQSKVICVTAASDADAFTIFETLNDRGADLTIVDLLKNYLFSKSSNEIDSVQQNWVESRAILDDYQDAEQFLIFLRHYWSSVYGMTRERELYRDIKSKIQSKSETVKFSNDLKQAARIYCAALSEKANFWKDYSEPDRNFVKLILRLKLEQNRPLLLAMLQHFSKREIQKSLPALLSWSVRGLISGILGKGKAESSYCETATKIRSGTVKTKEQLGSSLSSLIPGDALFSSAFEGYRTTNNAFARYLLLAIEKSLSGQAQPEFVPNENVDEVNLEHVLPRRAKSLDWPNFSADDVSFLSTKIGNMTLLQESKNNKIGNRAFSIKQPVLASSNYKINSLFKVSLDWTRLDIESRQRNFSVIAAKIWAQ
jgi:uncharacterized protein with ParB-like and HNH nuclease domain